MPRIPAWVALMLCLIPSGGLEHLSHTHLFPDAPQPVATPCVQWLAGSMAISSLPQLLGPLRPLSAPAHLCLVLTDVTLTLSYHGVQVPGPGGVCERILGPFAENLGMGGQ